MIKTEVRTDSRGLIKVINFLESEENEIKKGVGKNRCYFGLIEVKPFYPSLVDVSMDEMRGPAYLVGIQSLHQLPPDRINALTQLIEELYFKKN